MAESVDDVTNPLIREVIDQSPFSLAQGLIIATALILNMLDGFDVTAMSFTVHGIGQDLQLSADRLGIVFSIATAGMMLGAMFLAPLSDRIGRRSMLLICVSSIGGSMFLTGYATELWHLIVLRAITGLGVGSMLASLAAIASEYSPERTRSLAVVSITAGYPLGATAGGFIAAPLIEQYGWQSVFFAGGGATLLMLVAVYYLVPESLQFLCNRRPTGALDKANAILRRLGKQEISELPSTGGAASMHKPNVASLLKSQWRSSTIRLWLTAFCCLISLYFLLSWVPKLVIDAGLSEATGIYASVAFNGGGVIGILVLGVLAARYPLSKLIGSFLFTAAVGMLLFSLTDGIQRLMLYLGVIGFFLSAGFTGVYAVAAKLYPTELRATGIGWAIGLGRFGAVVGPFLGGLLIAASVTMESSFLIFAAPLLVGGLLAYSLAVR